MKLCPSVWMPPSEVSGANGCCYGNNLPKLMFLSGLGWVAATGTRRGPGKGFLYIYYYYNINKSLA